MGLPVHGCLRHAGPALVACTGAIRESVQATEHSVKAQMAREGKLEHQIGGCFCRTSGLKCWLRVVVMILSPQCPDPVSFST